MNCFFRKCFLQKPEPEPEPNPEQKKPEEYISQPIYALVDSIDREEWKILITYLYESGTYEYICTHKRNKNLTFKLETGYPTIVNFQANNTEIEFILQALTRLEERLVKKENENQKNLMVEKRNSFNILIK